MMRRLLLPCLSLTFFGFFVACKPKKDEPNAPTTAADAQPEVPRPSADIDPDAPFNLIPKDEDISQKVAALPQGQSLRLADPVQGTGSLTDFYLAIKKSELDKPWFLTAATKQLFPSWYASPYFNLGTRIVKFSVQNGKLFVFDTDERRNASKVSAPTVVVDAYPIVALSPALSKLGISSDFIIFDPAAGLSQHGPMQDLFARLSGGDISMQTDIKYLRRYNKLQDGIYYEMVFSGVTNIDLTQGFTVDQQDPNPSRVVGTLGMSLRRYQETPKFETFDASSVNSPFYFSGADQVFGPDATQTPNRPGNTNPVLRWGQIKPGMSPITFRVTPQIRLTQMQFPEYDVLGAITRGVESWNQVFGFPVFKVVVGNSQDSWAADDSNMIIWDNNADIGYAYADARINPKTGEIRAANIYMDAMWVYYADDFFSFLPFPAGPKTAGRSNPLAKSSGKTPHLTGFSWGNLRPINLCGLRLRPAAAKARAAAASTSAAAATSPSKLDRKLAVENYLANVIAHEAGHVLGLRHNFLGSTYKDNETSSIMDYYDDFLSAVAPNPAVYDVDAAKYLYGMKSTQPAQAFCTDEDLSTNPLCRQFDYGIDPLQTMILAKYRALATRYVKNPDPDLEAALAYYIQQALDFLQGGSLAQQTAAWNGLIKDLRAVPVAAGSTAPASAVDRLSQMIVDAAFFTANADSDFSQIFTQKPTVENGLAPQLATDLAAIALNVDGIRSMDSRRRAIDALKKIQRDAGLQSLTKLKTDLTSRKATLPAADAVLENDLIVRVDKYLSPYFD